jgi:hypothetical protein
MRGKKTDANHAEIRASFRNLGVYWKDVFQLPAFCDGLVIVNGVTVAVEVKDGEKPPSERRLTKAEDEFMQEWTSAGGHYRIVESSDDVVRLVSEFNRRPLTGREHY